MFHFNSLYLQSQLMGTLYGLAPTGFTSRACARRRLELQLALEKPAHQGENVLKYNFFAQIIKTFVFLQCRFAIQHE